VTSRRHLDAELVRRGLSRSREHARDMIDAGHVAVAGVVATKATTQVTDGISIVVNEATDRYVSRGAHKLIGALDSLNVTVADRLCLDAGISTGGFTQVLLERGARQVIGVDVGYGQLAWSLRTDPRVTLLERTNVRSITPADLPFAPDLIVADLSFIGLGVVLPALIGVAAPEADLLLMVKPQFEVGRGRVGAGGVVREPSLRVEAVTTIATEAHAQGWGTVGVVASPLPGPQGNVEYFLLLHEGAPPPLEADIARSVQEGPA
jgi:23S rRNA (cytidine1920-2'-O)/16S rRNA (cytidine1409-2'-O)-methyltransferase